MTIGSVPLAVVLAFSLSAAGRAGDWPQFRGPNRDDLSTETGLLKSWPKEGPPLLWKATGVGGGYSSISVAGDRIYTLGNKGRESFVVALARDTGKPVWSAKVGAAGGNLGCTPTVDGDKLVVTPGGKQATMAALDKQTGDTVWKCAIPVEHPQAGYSSAVIAEVGGVRQYVQLLNGGVVGVTADGRFLWKYEKLGPNTANIPTPIVLKDRVFAIAGYGKGAALLQLKAKGEAVSATEVYFTRAMTNKHGGVLCVGEHVFGDHDDGGRPFCADVNTGKVLWTRGDQGQGKGSASVTYADGLLYFHYQNGVVALVEASPASYKEVGSFQVPKTSGHCWAHPVVTGGRLYLREGDMVYCYDVRAER